MLLKILKITIVTILHFYFQALKLQPSIIFIDEIDSFLRSRSGSDHEATLMIKTQFMSFWDGLITNPSTHVMIMGASNRPQDVDAAILRRMPCQFKIGMPVCHFVDFSLLFSFSVNQEFHLVLQTNIWTASS